MRAIYAIVLKELRCDTSSLKFWAIIFFFLLFMGIFFFSYIDAFVGLTRSAHDSGSIAPNLSQMISSFFGIFHFILLLIVPAMTMGSFAEEHQKKTIKLLLSSPLLAIEVVSGKYLALMISMTVVLLASCVFPLFLLVYGKPDYGLLLSCYLGIYLLLGSHLAFGMWISSLVQNQFVAFLFSMLGLFLLLIMNTVSETIKGNDMTHQILKYLGASDHLSSFLQGYLVISDLVYFFVFTAFFLSLTCLSYNTLKWK
ncbi:MAG: ABC transporter permease [Oligoflexales bacterium]